MSLRESIARAIFETWSAAKGSDATWCDILAVETPAISEVRELAFLEADAVLKVLMEPSPQMREAAMEVLLHRGNIYANEDGQIVIESITPIELMQAMLTSDQSGQQ